MAAPLPPPIAVILAAGGSSRMGRSKALLSLPDGRVMLRVWLDALAPVCPERVVVAGKDVAELAALLGPGERLVLNPDWASTGPVDSLALALRSFSTAPARALVSPVDTPPPSASDLDALLAAPTPACLSWQGEPGHPVLLGPAEIRALREQAPPAGGLRSMLGEATRVPGGSARVLQDWDHPEDWQRLRAELGSA